MFGYRGRGGPSRSTPANVQCQKCLKRGHYSYECKASAQERPYTSRPSRSQQLRNPKLVPKLTNNALKPLEKKGVADEELAKIEAERARKRDLEEQEDGSVERDSRRRRSVSSASASTISTDASRRDSRSPRRRTKSPSPQRHGRTPDSNSEGSSRRSYSRSPSPPGRRRRSVSRDSRSPRGESNGRDYRDRGRRPSSERRSASPEQQRPNPREPAEGQDPRRQQYVSRSPEPQGRSFRGRDERGPRRGDTRRERGGGQRRMPAAQAPRERSLSPFSKRLALTQSLNMRGR